MNPEVLKLSDYRRDDDVADNGIDLMTAVDAAIRDLNEIMKFWDSDGARQRAHECEQMLSRAYSDAVAAVSD